MIPEAWRRGEAAVVGLGRSGVAATEYLEREGVRVYASDSADSPDLRAVADRLSGTSVAVDVGRHDLDRICGATVVVVSPGVPPDAAPLAAARRAGREILAELDLGAMALADVPMVVVTGTNGKTTTTALTAHVMREAGVQAEVAGNIGNPLTGVALRAQRPAWLVVEASSFQLHDAPHLCPTVGVLTNLSPDHLDRYPSTEAYFADKRNLFRNASASSTWVLNADDPGVTSLAGGVPGQRTSWSLVRPADAWYDRAARHLILGAGVALERDALGLLGDHNVANALAAALAATSAGCDPAAVTPGLASFRPLAHRLEPIRELDGVLWINDSKATNVSSALVAVDAMERPFVLIAGGRPKGQAFAPLAERLGPGCRGVVAYGEARAALERAFAGVAPVRSVAEFAEAVAEARRLASSGEVVLLSPACASFDQFANFEQRGAVFRRLVEAW